MSETQTSAEYQQAKLGTFKDLGTRWNTFIAILLHPDILLLILLIIGLGIFSYFSTSATSTELKGLFQIIRSMILGAIAILSGIVGARFHDKWSSLSDISVLSTRGKSAIRGLKLLSQNIARMNKRSDQYQADELANENQNQIILNSYKEFSDRCDSLQDETINAIEEWKDIIPEANITTEIGEIARLKTDQIKMKQEMTTIKRDQELERGKTDEEIESFRSKLESKGDELEKIRIELANKEKYLASSGYSGMSATPSGSILWKKIDDDLTLDRCSSCGTMFARSPYGGVCPSCGTIIVVQTPKQE